MTSPPPLPGKHRPPGLRLHPRTLPVNQAGAELQAYIWKFQEEKRLTDVEMLLILTESQCRITTLMLRRERHPDAPDRKADEE